MTLTELTFAMFWLVVIVFGSVFFAEWAEKHTHRVMQWDSLRTSGCLHCYGAEC